MAVAMRYGSNEYSRSGGTGGGGSGGGITMSLLWTNPSPASSFAAQTVSLDLSGYDAVVIFCRDFATSDSQSAIGSTWVLKGTTGSCIMASRASSSTGKRMATVSNTGIDFTYNGYNGNSDNARNVPLYIYGVRGIT